VARSEREVDAPVLVAQLPAGILWLATILIYMGAVVLGWEPVGPGRIVLLALGSVQAVILVIQGFLYWRRARTR
jgi:hypothetical protein